MIQKNSRVFLKQIMSFFLAFLLACAFPAFVNGEASDDFIPAPTNDVYRLTDQDLEEALLLIRELEEHINDGNNLKIIKKAKELEKKHAYISYQHAAAMLGYYSDLQDEDARERYETAQEADMAVQDESMRVLNKLYQSDLWAKNRVFGSWRDADILEMEASGDELTALKTEQMNLRMAYLELEDYGSEKWVGELEEIYFSFVKCANQYARLLGYDNYYDYASKVEYMRDYTRDQRDALRDNVKTLVYPFYQDIYLMRIDHYDELSRRQTRQINEINYSSYLSNEGLLLGYIDSQPRETKTVMNHLFDRNALMVTDSERAYEAAFTSYSVYAEQPYVYLGHNFQNLLTLVHELGHYTAYYHFSDENLPFETSEVQSFGNEWMMINYLETQLKPEVYKAVLLARLYYGLESAILSTLSDEFQEAVYTCGDLTSPEGIREIYDEVVAGYAGFEGMDSCYRYALTTAMDPPVYALNYTTSELAALSFFEICQSEGYEAAQDVYVDICLKTPTGKSFFDTLSDVGLPNPTDAELLSNVINSFYTILEYESIEPAA